MLDAGFPDRSPGQALSGMTSREVQRVSFTNHYLVDDFDCQAAVSKVKWGHRLEQVFEINFLWSA